MLGQQWRTPMKKDDLIEFAKILAALGVLIVCFMIVVHFVNKAACHNGSEIVNKPVQYEYWGGCYVQLNNGQWVPVANWRVEENTFVK